MSDDVRLLRVAVIGETEAFFGLLVDVLRDLRVEVELSRTGRPDLVFAVVRQRDLSRVLDSAQRAALGAPIVAVLPIGDSHLSQRAVLAGADAVCSLDGPLDRLRVAFLSALARRALESRSATP